MTGDCFVADDGAVIIATVNGKQQRPQFERPQHQRMTLQPLHSHKMIPPSPPKAAITVEVDTLSRCDSRLFSVNFVLFYEFSANLLLFFLLLLVPSSLADFNSVCVCAMYVLNESEVLNNGGMVWFAAGFCFADCLSTFLGRFYAFFLFRIVFVLPL